MDITPDYGSGIAGSTPAESTQGRLAHWKSTAFTPHAGKTVDHGVRLPDGPHRAELERIKEAAREGRDEPALRLFRPSAVLCLVRFTGVHSANQCLTLLPGAARWCTPWSMPAQVHHEVTLLAALPEPVPCGGQRGKWYLPDDVESAVRAQLEAK